DRWADELWGERRQWVSTDRHLCGSRPQRREAGRPSGRATDQIRTGRQPQHCQGDRPRNPAEPARHRRRDHRMKRRAFITLLGSAAAMWPLAARAQQASSPVVALLSSGRLPESLIGIFRQGLAEQGYLEGRNVVIDYRHVDNQYERLAGLAAEF